MISIIVTIYGSIIKNERKQKTIIVFSHFFMQIKEKIFNNFSLISLVVQ